MLQKICKFLLHFKFQLENLLDLKQCCKTRIYLQRSAQIQPKTSEILPKFCQKLATTLRVPGPVADLAPRSGVVAPPRRKRFQSPKVAGLQKIILSEQNISKIKHTESY